jgi:hypothetical protein
VYVIVFRRGRENEIWDCGVVTHEKQTKVTVWHVEALMGMAQCSHYTQGSDRHKNRKGNK